VLLSRIITNVVGQHVQLHNLPELTRHPGEVERGSHDAE